MNGDTSHRASNFRPFLQSVLWGSGEDEDDEDEDDDKDEDSEGLLPFSSA